MGDKRAKDRLIQSNLRLVIGVAPVPWTVEGFRI
jgi:DNA-directed RNA polymerase sigma subunit (sigma70/sigma32)